MSNNTRNNVKMLAANIENLARDVQSKLDADTDFLVSANELVRNNLTLVFTLGELYALQQVGGSKTVTASSVNNSRNYHNVRDPLGRFTRKV